ncbi:MAG: glycosyltransferase family 4 protein [Cyanobacteria bacterium P01_H01_bin.15]
MRILIYSYNYHPEPIGIAPLMTELAEGLAQREHQVRVVTALPWYPGSMIYPEYRGNLYRTETRNNVTIQRSFVWAKPERSFRNRGLFEISFMGLSLLQALKGPRPDVILLVVPGLPVSIPAAFVSWWYRAPLILNLQDILPDAAVHVGLLTNPRLIKIFEKLEKFAYRHATKISVIANGFTKNLLQKGIPNDKIVEISNWVNVDFIRPTNSQQTYFRTKNQLTDKFIVLYSGNIALTQGLETVIRAAPLLTDLTDLVFTIVGELKAIAELRAYCQAQGADINNVQFFNFQPREKLPEMLGAANLALVMQKSNVIAFNMPSKIQVLLASGRPILASVPSNGTAANAINTSGGGMVVSPEDPKALADAIRMLYSDRERLKVMGKQGRAYAERTYAFSQALDRYEQLFKEAQIAYQQKS